jgi:colanic acid biosynthesis glycosyl transferase WcaI
LTGIGKYTGEMADWLVDNGYDCTVVTAFPYYPNWKIQAPYKGNFYKKEVLKDGKLVVYRCTLYVPAKPTGLKRIIHDASFYLSSFFMTLFLLFKEGNGHIFCMVLHFILGF